MLMTGETTQIKLPRPHPGQIAVREQAKRFNVLSAARRWRKTTLVMSILVDAALEGGTYLWCAPTFSQARIGFEETQHAAGGTVKFNLSRMIADFPTGGRIVFISLDNPDNARGWSANGIAIDEAGTVKEQAWIEVLRPMLVDSGGWAWIVGTPAGRNWFWREHLAAKDSPDSIAWQIPTLGVKVDNGRLIRDPHPLENPDIPFEEIERLWHTMPEKVFRQEVLAEFVEDHGTVFRGIRAAATAKPQDSPIDGHQYIAGLDWGKSNDFTVMTIIDLTTNELVYLDRYNQIDYVFQLGRVKALYDRFRPDTIIAERNSMGEPLVEQLQREGLPIQPFITTNATKTAAIEALSLAFERGELKIIPDETLINELLAFEISRTSTGLVKYSAPAGVHDDTVLSTAIAWSGAKTSWSMW